AELCGQAQPTTEEQEYAPRQFDGLFPVDGAYTAASVDGDDEQDDGRGDGDPAVGEVGQPGQCAADTLGLCQERDEDPGRGRAHEHGQDGPLAARHGPEVAQFLTDVRAGLAELLGLGRV